jgi:DNA mismatch endonuclease, patch repair protein
MLTPQPASPNVSARLARQSSKDTAPELALRRELHRRGRRFRVHLRPLQGLRRTADIVFPRHRVAVFVDGCFWHRCPEHGSDPKNNSAWWDAKLRRNVERDRETDRILEDSGWTAVRVWEHEAVDAAADRVEQRLDESSRTVPYS